MKLLPRNIFQTRSHAFTYHQLGIFMLFPLWPLLVSYVRKKHQIYRGCSGVFRDDEPKICQGSCFLSTRKNTVSHGKKEQHDAGVNYSKLGGNSRHRFADTSTNSQLTTSSVGNDPNNLFKASFFSIKKPEKNTNKTRLVGGWTNPFEKYESNWIISTNREWKSKIFETTN